MARHEGSLRSRSWTRLLGLSLLAAALAAGCGAQGGDKDKDKDKDKKSESTSKSTSKEKTADTAKPSESAVAKSDGVDVKDILKGDPGAESSNVLSVDLSKVDDTAPALGGKPAKPPEPAAGGQVEWLPVGPLQIANPGWQKAKEDDIGVLMSPDQKAAVLFTHFDTNENGAAKVDAVVEALKLKNTRWQKAQPVKLGANNDIPALVGIGEATDAEGKPVKLFFALMKTDNPNVLAMGGWDADAPKEIQDATVNILLTAKKSGS